MSGEIYLQLTKWLTVCSTLGSFHFRTPICYAPQESTSVVLCFVYTAVCKDPTVRFAVCFRTQRLATRSPIVRQEAEATALAGKVASMESTIGSLVAHKDDEVDRLRSRVLNT